MADKVTITLDKIKCIKKSERGHDEVYIEYYADGGDKKRYPHDGGNHPMAPRKDNIWEIDLDMSYDKYLLVELRDNDVIGSDPLGSTTFSREDASSSMKRLVSDPNGAEYELYINQR